MIDHIRLKELRKEHKFTQDEVAGMLGVSRVTYNLIENGKTPREPYKEQLEDIFDVSFHALNNNKPKPKRVIDNEEEYIKIKNLIMYILDKTAQLPNVGKTVLYKILYFCEFDWFELTGKRLTGMDFVKLPRGPAPAGFDDVIKKMTAEEVVVPVNAKYMGYIQQRYLINEKVPHDLWQGREKEVIDRVIHKLKDMNAKEISNYSHGDLPWKATKDMELIDINLAYQREYPYSARIQEAKRARDRANFSDNPAFSFLLDEPDLYDDLI